MSYLIRKAELNDISQLARLLEDYVRETYHGAWAGTAERLEQDGFGNRFEIVVALDSNGEVFAFVAWINTYDLHWCIKGAEVIDLFVSASHRGRGIAILLLACAAEEIQAKGGLYLKGGAVDNPAVRRLYSRCAMCLPGGESYLSGRAFRHLAALSGKSPREVLINLPETDWNYEP